MTDLHTLCREMGLGPVWTLRAAPQPALPEAGPLPEYGETAVMVPPASSSSPTMEHLPPSGGSPALAAQLDWDGLAAAVSTCRLCALCDGRKQAVLGLGDRRADWLFVSEGPGAEEDQRGEPFVGQAGKLLDAMLASIGIRRGEDVYIANSVKCRPPANRTPEPEETAACWPYLERQIELLQPRLIVALGRPAAQTLLQTEVKIGAARGQLHRYRGIPVIVTYHPAYLLRNLPDKALAWQDLVFMRRTMASLKNGG